MVSSRTLSVARPVFPYGSKAYTILYYGVSRKSEFKTSEIKACFQGLFPHKTRNTDFLEPAGRLVKAGLLQRVNEDTWVITRNGIAAMVSAAAYYREFRIRTTSIKYIEDAAERIRQIHSTNMGIMEKLDAEDLILEEIEDTIARRQRKKNASKL
jgi:hypothetical protein